MSALDFNVQPLETIADLKGRVDIADFVSRYVKLKRSGADYGGLCPFHAERTPSFQVSPRWQNFKCWGCGVAGDVFDFIGALEGLKSGPWGAERVGCIVAPVENLAGDLVAIWRIRPVMDGKVERRGLGPVKGCFAPVIDHAGLDVITIAEGVEDALSAWVLTTYPAWAALSAEGMAALQLPAQFKQIIISADAEPVGIEAARKLAGRLRAEGREARVIVPEVGKDANDVLRARAA